MYETRLARVFCLFAGALALLALRAFTLQVASQEAVLKAHDERVHGRFVVAPRRGEILWSDGTPMASNEPGFSVEIDVAEFFAARRRCEDCGGAVRPAARPAKCPDCGSTRPLVDVAPPDASELARLLGVSLDDLGDALERADAARAGRPDVGRSPLLRDIDRDTALAVSLAVARFPGVTVRAKAGRVIDAEGRDVVGRTRDAYQSDVDALCDPERATETRVPLRRSDVLALRFGRSGLEATFDERLRGEPGRSHRGPRREGRPRETIVDRPVADGAAVVTTLRREVQIVANEIVDAAPGDAAAVCLDLRDGAVVAIASKSADGLNHAVCGLRPGSVFKLATSLALLESGVSPGDMVTCTRHGPLPGGGRYVCDDEHGPVAFEEAFARSCNAYFATMAQRVGVDAMRRACRELGLDVNPRLHLAGSPCGLEYAGEGGRWRPDDLGKIGIGQGKALVSPLQVAVAFGRFGAGGRALTPFLVGDERSTATGVDPAIARFAPLVAAAARRCVTSGTGAAVRELDAVEAAGKSGTGDTRADRDENNAWFAAFAPASSPRYVAVVVYEKVPGHGASTAGRPVARLLAEALR
jgi:penicillin-binding protein 2